MTTSLEESKKMTLVRDQNKSFYTNRSKLWLIFIIALLILVIRVSPNTILWQNLQSMLAPQKVNITVVFEESDQYLPNPFMGPVAFARKQERLFEGTIVAATYTWADIEKTKGMYDFVKAEENSNYNYWINEQDNQYMLLFVMDQPVVAEEIDYSHFSIPMWLYQELKQQAELDYTEKLDTAIEKNDEEAIIKNQDALYKISNDEEVISNFNLSMASTADIPGVGTLYRWSMQAPGGEEKYQVGFSPNYASPLLIDYHDKAIQAIANRYDHEKTYAIIMGSLGHWGEMHTTYIRGEEFTGRYPVVAISSQYEQAYAKYFKNTIVSSRAPREIARDNNFGLHNHSFGDPRHTYDWFKDWYTEGYQDHFTKDHHPAMPDFWENAPSGAEVAYTDNFRYLTDDYIEGTLGQARDTHLTWVLEHWYTSSPEINKNMEKLISIIGYRFVITEANFNNKLFAGDSLNLTSTWINNGTAPFYYDWPIVAQLHNSEGTVVAEAVVSSSVRKLFLGFSETYHTELELPVTLSTGQYQLWVGIFDPGAWQPAVQLAVKNRPQKDHMTFVGDVEITSRPFFR